MIKLTKQKRETKDKQLDQFRKKTKEKPRNKFLVST